MRCVKHLHCTVSDYSEALALQYIPIQLISQVHRAAWAWTELGHSEGGNMAPLQQEPAPAPRGEMVAP